MTEEHHEHGGLDDLHAELDTTPTFETAREGDVATLAAVLDADSEQLHARDKYGLTALHWACDRGQVAVATLLLERGADVNALEKRIFKRTPLLFAALEPGAGELVSLLLRYGASLTAADHKGWRALHCAAHAGSVDVVRALVAEGADLSALTARGESVLHLAARGGHAELVQQLVQFGEDADAAQLLDVRDADGCSAADVARTVGQTALAAYLAGRKSS
ncbi:hypothetical protein PybrP1_000245 [[Pythium] brassicae (nom. inval.)]|nr:hypothetical protein PybrP1_000245 [[Pythium] brassicae (nom. inval.)]